MRNQSGAAIVSVTSAPDVELGGPPPFDQRLHERPQHEHEVEATAVLGLELARDVLPSRLGPDETSNRIMATEALATLLRYVCGRIAHLSGSLVTRDISRTSGVRRRLAGGRPRAAVSKSGNRSWGRD
jgi:hypothetical protein